MQKNSNQRLKVNRQEPKSKDTPAKISEIKDIVCEHCNLHFSTEAWLKKHIASNHAGTSSVSNQKYDPKAKILNYKKQLDVIQQTLDKKGLTEKTKKKATKQVSPTKQKLREQLKAQLAAQQKLLQVQQEIFEKTSKAQQDIFELIAKLGDDSDGDDEGDQESEFIKCESVAANAQDTEVYYDNPDGELIVAENVQEYAYITPDNYEIEEQQLITDDGGYVMLNDQNVIGESVHEDQAVMVIVRSGDDEEEYELLDVVEDQLYESNPLEQIENGIDFEVIGNDKNSVHCRIVANEEAQEELEFVDVQVDKVPVKLEVGKIQQIAQKRFDKQLDKIKGDENSEDSKLLNSTINKSEKHTNEYIQKVVQNAVPSDDNKFECPICHEKVSNRYSLGPHILRLHSKQKSKICQYCDRSFTCTGDLTR